LCIGVWWCKIGERGLEETSAGLKSEGRVVRRSAPGTSLKETKQYMESSETTQKFNGRGWPRFIQIFDKGHTYEIPHRESSQRTSDIAVFIGRKSRSAKYFESAKTVVL
jgi:hypothetical protein